jgi:hypothetical protein
VAILGQQLAPHLYVPILNRSQLSIDLGPPRVPFSPRQLPVQEGRVGLVFQVVEPIVWRGSG